MCISTINENTIIEIIKITILLVTAANIIANDTSAADNGANKVSVMLPCILAIIKDDTECEKLCWITDIDIRPGARKLIKEKPNTSPLSFPIAKESTDKNNKLEISGERSV